MHLVTGLLHTLSSLPTDLFPHIARIIGAHTISFTSESILRNSTTIQGTGGSTTSTARERRGIQITCLLEIFATGLGAYINAPCIPRPGKNEAEELEESAALLTRVETALRISVPGHAAMSTELESMLLLMLECVWTAQEGMQIVPQPFSQTIILSQRNNHVSTSPTRLSNQ